MKMPKVPDGFEVVRTYARLGFFFRAFGEGTLNLLAVVGPPGTAKSTHARTVAGEGAAVIEGGASPYGLYEHLYDARDLPVILDDSDRVFREKQGIFLLKMLCQSEEKKVIQWNTVTPEIRAGELAKEFTTTSTVCIIANSWPAENPDVAALESRAETLYFLPSPEEIHAYAGGWFRDREPEVYDFIGRHLDCLDAPDLRLYYKAGQRRRMGDDWRGYVLSRCYQGDEAVAAGLLRDVQFPSDHQRALEFAQRTGRSSRTFYRLKRRLEKLSKCQTSALTV
jgi:hypothetical protein